MYHYYAYKNKSNEVYRLKVYPNFTASIDSSSPTQNAIIAIKANVTENYLTSSEFTGDINLARFDITSALESAYISTEYLTSALITSESSANSLFSSVYKIVPSTWTDEIALGIQQLSTSCPNETEINENKNYTSQVGMIYKNYNFTSFVYVSGNLISSCTPNWTEVNTSCSAQDTFIGWFNDTNNCASSSNRPINRTYYCDYNNNGIIGNSSDITKVNVVADLYINNTPLNLSKNYTEQMAVEFGDVNLARIYFVHDFSLSPLNLKSVKIEKQAYSNSYGYLIVSGLNLTKEITIDRINKSNQVCVKDAHVSSISGVSTYCNSTNEYFIQCPGINLTYSCTATNYTYTIAGLSSSAARELLSTTSSNNPIIPVVCTPSWNCTEWSECISNQQSRICSDSNNCNDLTNKPAEIQSCTPLCTPSWNCTEWLPKKCPKNQTQSRICTDFNSCGVSTGKPAESQSCTYEPSKLPKFFFYLVIIILLGILIAAVVYLIIKLRNPGVTRNDELLYQVNQGFSNQ